MLSISPPGGPRRRAAFDPLEWLLNLVWGRETRLDVGQWRLDQRWYQRRRWRWRRGPLPRRARLIGVPVVLWPARPAVVWNGYPLFPSGMHRSLYGSYLMYISAFEEIARWCGPPLGEFGTLDEAEAERAVRAAVFTPSAARARIARTARGEEDWICDRVLNGMYPAPLRRVRSGEGEAELELTIDWGSLPRVGPSRRGEPLHLAGVEARLVVDGERLRLRSVTVRYPDRRLRLDPAHPWWRRALHVLRCALLLQGELEVHLARTHLLAEFVQVALHRTLDPLHPVRRLLEPHVDGADVINRVGDWLVLGDQGVIAAVTPLTGDAVARRLAHELGGVDWRGFRPRAPLCGADLFARAANELWDRLGGFVEDALGPVDPIGDRALAGFVAELHRRSVPHRPPHQDPDRWTHGSELPPPRAGGPAFSRVDTPADVLQLCRFVVYHTTFLHTWVNDAQWDDGGDPGFASLALRARIDELPEASYDAWAEQARPDWVDTGYQQLVAYALTRLDAGTVLADDLVPRVPERFRDLVRQLGPPWVQPRVQPPPDDLRLRADWLRSRVNS